jgi:hypothetical protein
MFAPLQIVRRLIPGAISIQGFSVLFIEENDGENLVVSNWQKAGPAPTFIADLIARIQSLPKRTVNEWNCTT